MVCSPVSLMELGKQKLLDIQLRTYLLPIQWHITVLLYFSFTKK